MTAKAFITSLPSFVGLDGLPLSGGSIYFGEPSQDPREYPKAVFFDQALSVPAAQPLRTQAGLMYRTGTPTNIWADGNCSVLVLDSKGRQVQYFTDWAGAGIVADVSDVAAIAAAVTAVAGVASDVQTLAPHAANIDAVAGHVTNIDTVAPHVANIDTVAPHVANIDTVAAHVANIDTAAAHATNIDTVAAHAANIDAVTPHVANIDALAPQAANIALVGGSIANVNIVAGDKANVDIVAANIVAVQQALAAGKIYLTTTDGLANSSGTGTTNRYFFVPATATGEALILYQNSAGSAVQVARFPSADYILRGAFAVETLGVADTSLATTALSGGRTYGVGQAASFPGYVRKVNIRTLAAQTVRVFVARDAGGGILQLVGRVCKITTTGVGAETILLTEDLPIAAGQYVCVYFESGAPYFVLTSGVGVLTATGGMVTEAGLAFTLNTTITIGVSFQVEAADRFEWSRAADRELEAVQKWTGSTLGALGTSITEAQYYAAMAAQRLGADFVNLGYGGQTWSGATPYIYERATFMDPRVELVTIEGPINDFRLGKALGSVRDTNQTTSTLGALYAMAQDLFEANPFRSVAVVLSPPNMDSGFAGKWDAANSNGVYWNEFCEAVTKQAEWLGLQVIRPHNMNGFTAKWQAADLIHPDQTTGAPQLANAVTFALARFPKTRVAQCATPVVAFNIATGQVTITCATAGSTIRYTTDGSNPTTTSTVYAGAFTPADGDIEIRAIATATGYGRSPQRRAKVTKNTTSGLGGGTWNLRPAVLADISSTRGVVKSLEGGPHYSVDVEPGATNNSAIWLATGSNNAVEFELAKGVNLEFAVGIGASGWLTIGYAALSTINQALIYNLTTGAIGVGATISPALTHASGQPTRIYRLARVGTVVKIYEKDHGVWSTITAGLDLATLGGATAGYYDTAQLGVLVDVLKAAAPIKNVRVGTLV